MSELAAILGPSYKDWIETGDWVKVVTPSGKIGYLSANVIAPVGSDQLCYQKEGGSWKIAGYVGAGTGQE